MALANADDGVHNQSTSPPCDGKRHIRVPASDAGLAGGAFFGGCLGGNVDVTRSRPRSRPRQASTNPSTARAQDQAGHESQGQARATAKAWPMAQDQARPGAKASRSLAPQTTCMNNFLYKNNKGVSADHGSSLKTLACFVSFTISLIWRTTPEAWRKNTCCGKSAAHECVF